MTEKKELENNEGNGEDEKDRIVRKTISVKGVSADLYKKIQKVSNDTGKTIGQLTDEAYRSFVGSVEGAKHISESFVKGLKEGSSQFIENIKELEISGKDLEEVGRRIVFRNIETLTFTDLDNDQFSKYVLSVINVKTVKIPASVSKAKLLLKSNFVDKIVTY